MSTTGFTRCLNVKHSKTTSMFQAEYTVICRYITLFQYTHFKTRQALDHFQNIHELTSIAYSSLDINIDIDI